MGVLRGPLLCFLNRSDWGLVVDSGAQVVKCHPRVPMPLEQALLGGSLDRFTGGRGESKADLSPVLAVTHLMMCPLDRC